MALTGRRKTLENNTKLSESKEKNNSRVLKALVR